MKELQRVLFENIFVSLLFGAYDVLQAAQAKIAITKVANKMPFPVVPEGLQPAEAIAWFKRKEVLPIGQFQSLRAAAKQRAFTVTTEQNKTVLQKVKKAVEQALIRGDNFFDWQKNVESKLGDTLGLTFQNPFHMETVFRTNIQTAYQAGRFQQMEETKTVRPYKQYVTVGDSNVRDTHAALDGIIKPADDPFWKTFNPPNGFNAVLPDTLIKTPRGDIPINELRKGDLVLTHKNRYRPVSMFMRKYEKTTIYRITMENGRVLSLTGEHPLLTDVGWVYTRDITDDMRLLALEGETLKMRQCPVCGKQLKPQQKKVCSVACSNKQCKTKGETSVVRLTRLWLDAHNIEYIQEAKAGKYNIDFLLPFYSIALECAGFREDQTATRDKILSDDFHLHVCRMSEVDIKNGNFNKVEILINNVQNAENKKDHTRALYGDSLQPCSWRR